MSTTSPFSPLPSMAHNALQSLQMHTHAAAASSSGTVCHGCCQIMEQMIAHFHKEHAGSTSSAPTSASFRSIVAMPSPASSNSLSTLGSTNHTPTSTPVRTPLSRTPLSSQSASASSTPISTPLKTSERQKKTRKAMTSPLPQEAPAAASSAKKARVSKSKTDSTQWYDSQSEFFTHLAAVKGESTFLDRIKKFNTILSPVHNVNNLIIGHVAWVTFGTSQTGESIYYKISITQDQYYSDAFDPSAFGDELTNATHYYIKINEFIGEDTKKQRTTPLLYMRASETNGEIIKIAAGTFIKGNEINKICTQIVESLKIKMYLFDDSKIKEVLPKESSIKGLIHDIHLKAFAIGDPEGKTWYERKLSGFHTATCHQWKMVVKKDGSQPSINQNPQNYHSALETARSFPLKELHTLLDGSSNFEQTLQKITDITKSLFADEPDFALSTTNKTMQNLVAQIADCVKKTLPKTEAGVKARENQLIVYNTFLFPKDSLESTPETAKKWWQAIQTMAETRVWVRTDY